jgi:hypothetical protein
MFEDSVSSWSFIRRKKDGDRTKQCVQDLPLLSSGEENE